MGRLLRWRGVNAPHATAAMERALELVDLTLVDPRWQKRVGELLRLREVIADLGQEKSSLEVSPDSIYSYFAPFALLHSARNVKIVSKVKPQTSREV